MYRRKHYRGAFNRNICVYFASILRWRCRISYPMNNKLNLTTSQRWFQRSTCMNNVVDIKFNRNWKMNKRKIDASTKVICKKICNLKPSIFSEFRICSDCDCHSIGYAGSRKGTRWQLAVSLRNDLHRESRLVYPCPCTTIGWTWAPILVSLSIDRLFYSYFHPKFTVPNKL